MALDVDLGMAGPPAEQLLGLLKQASAQNQALSLCGSTHYLKIVDVRQFHVEKRFVPGHQNGPLVGDPILLPHEVPALRHGRNQNHRSHQQHQADKSHTGRLGPGKIHGQQPAAQCHRQSPLQQDLLFCLCLQKRKRGGTALPADLLSRPQICFESFLHTDTHSFCFSAAPCHPLLYAFRRSTADKVHLGLVKRMQKSTGFPPMFFNVF